MCDLSLVTGESRARSVRQHSDLAAKPSLMFSVDDNRCNVCEKPGHEPRSRHRRLAGDFGQLSTVYPTLRRRSDERAKFVGCDPQETLGIPRQAPFALAANRPFGPAAAPATSRQASPPEQTIVDPRRAHRSAIRAIGDARRELVNAPDPDWELIIRIIKESYAG